MCILSKHNIDLLLREGVIWRCTYWWRQSLIIWIIGPIETLFYPTTGISLHFDRFVWRQVAERLPLFHFARSPRVLVQCIAGSAVDVRFLLAIFKEGARIVFHRLADTRRI